MYANNDISLAIEFIKKPMVLMPSVFLQEIKGSEILLQYKYDILFAGNRRMFRFIQMNKLVKKIRL